MCIGIADAPRFTLEKSPEFEEGKVVELSLLLPEWQIAALEATAHRQGLTTGQLVRRVLGDFFVKYTQSRPA